MERGDKETSGKAAFAGLSPAALFELARLAELGAEKYGQFNYMKGIPFSALYSALQRHAWRWWAGEERDPDDGQHHLASVAWHALALLHYVLHAAKYANLDDRPHVSIERLGGEVLNYRGD